MKKIFSSQKIPITPNPHLGSSESAFWEKKSSHGTSWWNSSSKILSLIQLVSINDSSKYHLPQEVSTNLPPIIPTLSNCSSPFTVCLLNLAKNSTSSHCPKTIKTLPKAFSSLLTVSAVNLIPRNSPIKLMCVANAWLFIALNWQSLVHRVE